MRTLVYTSLLFWLLSACRDAPIVTEGFISVEGGNIWYKIVGADKSKTPLLLIHGGPGFPSDYLKPLEELASERPVIFYDQLGCGRSDRPNDTTLWQLGRFVEELRILRTALRLSTVHLLGHSAGTMLALEYLATQPKGIKTVILSGPIVSIADHLQTVNKLKRSLPPAIRDSLLFYERAENLYAAGYQKAYDAYLKIHWCRVYPFPKAIQKSLQLTGGEVFQTMWGEYEFFCPGNLKSFDRFASLRNLSMATLFTCGRFDICTPANTRRYAAQVKGSQFVVFEKSAHMTMNEEPDAYVETIRKFLSQNE